VVCRYHLALAGPVPASVVEAIGARFGQVTIRSPAGPARLDGVIVDQAAVRALLNLVWDAGGEVRLLRVGVDAAPGRPGVPGAAGS
jgi:hypothetical protein